MLPAEVLDLLRQWWKARPRWYDVGVAPEQRWLFPGRNRHQPLTTRQFGRLFKETVKAAGLRKTLSLHLLRGLGLQRSNCRLSCCSTLARQIIVLAAGKVDPRFASRFT